MAQQRPPLLYGAEAISDYLGVGLRQVYHLHEIKKIPTFKIGTKVCARWADLDAWLEQQAKGGQA